jgi:hypothetical protein
MREIQNFHVEFTEHFRLKQYKVSQFLDRNNSELQNYNKDMHKLGYFLLFYHLVEGTHQIKHYLSIHPLTHPSIYMKRFVSLQFLNDTCTFYRRQIFCTMSDVKEITCSILSDGQ